MALAVIAPSNGHNLVGLPVLGGEHQGRIVRFRARVCEEDLGVGYAGKIGDLLGQKNLIFDEVKRRRVQHLVGLRLDR